MTTLNEPLAAETVNGDAPKDLPTLAPTPKAGKSRDVFLFAISGFKERNPAAAAALLERLKI